MKRKSAMIIILTVLFAILTLFLISSSALTKEPVSETEVNRTWTKAICSSDNHCRDYEIKCHDKKLIEIVPISEIVHFSGNWEDPRSREKQEELC